MPELPDVETMRRFLESRALHREVASVEVLDARAHRGLAPTALGDALTGRSLVGTARRGKWLFAEAAAGPWLVLHFGMTGALSVTSPGQGVPSFTRVSFRFADGDALHFRDQRRFGRLGLTTAPEVFALEKRLGPDALDPKLTAAVFSQRVAGRRGPLKGVLLDQRVVAGIGNIYGDEICHAAGMSPFSITEHLTDDDRRRVYSAMRSVLRTAVGREAGAKGFPAGWLIPHRDAHGTCPRSGEPVARCRFQGRYTYWCPARQPTL